jgi:hypothetical protein
MVGPEVHEPLAKRLVGLHGDTVAGSDLLEIIRSELGAQPAEQALCSLAVRLRVVALAAQLGVGLEDVG